MNWRLFVIILYGILLRFWKLATIPPLINRVNLLGRFITAGLNIISIYLIYSIVRKLTSNAKIALLTAFIFTSLPWVIEQSRVVSPVNNSLFIMLLLFYLVFYLKDNIIKYITAILLLPFIYFIYPKLWVFNLRQNLPNFTNYLNNIFILSSADFLFFKNITFWWGGVREFGVMYISFIPFLIIGIYKAISEKQIYIILLSIFIIMFSALSPFFPESREFYLITPVFSFFIAQSIYHLAQKNNIFFRIIFSLILLLFLYNFGEYLHYYQIHYPQQIFGNIHKINEPF